MQERIFSLSKAHESDTSLALSMFLIHIQLFATLLHW